MPKGKYIVLDLDNTIFDDLHRYEKIDWQHPDNFWRFHPYHELAFKDECKNKHLFLEAKEEIIVITARPEYYRDTTNNSLKQHGITPRLMMMRQPDETRGSAVLKSELLDQALAWLEAKPCDITCAYDDRQDVVDMYLAKGVRAERAFINDEHLYLVKAH